MRVGSHRPCAFLEAVVVFAAGGEDYFVLLHALVPQIFVLHFVELLNEARLARMLLLGFVAFLEVSFGGGL